MVATDKKSIDKKQLLELADFKADACVSIYLGGSPSGVEGLQAPIRLKNLVGAAEGRLMARRMTPVAARELLAPAARLVDDAEFMRKQPAGWAIFLAEGFERIERLPFAPPEHAFVDERFHVRPLLGLLNAGREFLLLALSRNRARLHRAVGDELCAVDQVSLPDGVKAALGLDTPEGMFQHHTGARAANAAPTAVFHGQGGAPDEAKAETAAYLREIERAIEPWLARQTAPLVFAGVDELFAEFKRMCEYARLLPENISGNADYLAPHELFEAARPIVDREFARPATLALSAAAQGRPRGMAATDPAEVVPAAATGRVAQLVIRGDAQEWGALDATNGRVALEVTCKPDSEDLVERAALETLRHGGDVFVVDRERMPGKVSMAAVMRYAVQAAPA